MGTNGDDSHVLKDEDVYFSRGHDCFNKGLYDEAIENFTKAIQINPRPSGFTYYSRGMVYAKKRLSDLCLSDVKKAADLGYEPARRILKKHFNIDY